MLLNYKLTKKEADEELKLPPSTSRVNDRRKTVSFKGQMQSLFQVKQEKRKSLNKTIDLTSSDLNSSQISGKMSGDVSKDISDASSARERKAKMLVLKDKSSKQMWVQRVSKGNNDLLTVPTLLKSKVRARVKAKARKTLQQSADQIGSNEVSFDGQYESIETPNNNQYEEQYDTFTSRKMLESIQEETNKDLDEEPQSNILKKQNKQGHSLSEKRQSITTAKQRVRRIRSNSLKERKKHGSMTAEVVLDETQISENGCGGGYLEKRALLTKALIKHQDRRKNQRPYRGSNTSKISKDLNTIKITIEPLQTKKTEKSGIVDVHSFNQDEILHSRQQNNLFTQNNNYSRGNNQDFNHTSTKHSSKTMVQNYYNAQDSESPDNKSPRKRASVRVVGKQSPKKNAEKKNFAHSMVQDNDNGLRIFDGDVSSIAIDPDCSQFGGALIQGQFSPHNNYNSRDTQHKDQEVQEQKQGMAGRRDHSSLILKIESEEAKQINSMINQYNQTIINRQEVTQVVINQKRVTSQFQNINMSQHILHSKQNSETHDQQTSEKNTVKANSIAKEEELELEFDDPGSKVDTETLDRAEETPKFRVTGQESKKKRKVNPNKKIVIKGRPGTSMKKEDDSQQSKTDSQQSTPMNRDIYGSVSSEQISRHQSNKNTNIEVIEVNHQLSHHRTTTITQEIQNLQLLQNMIIEQDNALTTSKSNLIGSVTDAKNLDHHDDTFSMKMKPRETGTSPEINSDHLTMKFEKSPAQETPQFNKSLSQISSQQESFSPKKQGEVKTTKDMPTSPVIDEISPDNFSPSQFDPSLESAAMSLMSSPTKQTREQFKTIIDDQNKNKNAKTIICLEEEGSIELNADQSMQNYPHTARNAPTKVEVVLGKSATMYERSENKQKSRSPFRGTAKVEFAPQVDTQNYNEYIEKLEQKYQTNLYEKTPQTQGCFPGKRQESQISTIPGRELSQNTRAKMEKVQKVYDPNAIQQEKSPMRSLRGNIGGVNTKSQIFVPLHSDLQGSQQTTSNKLGFGVYRKNNDFGAQMDFSKQDSLQSNNNSPKKIEKKPMIQNKEKKVVKVMLDDEEDDSMRNQQRNITNFTNQVSTPSDSYCDIFPDERIPPSKLRKNQPMGKSAVNLHQDQKYTKRNLFESQINFQEMGDGEISPINPRKSYLLETQRKKTQLKCCQKVTEQDEQILINKIKQGESEHYQDPYKEKKVQHILPDKRIRASRPQNVRDLFNNSSKLW